MKKGFPKLKSDTWAIITAFGGWSVVIVTVMLSLHSVTNARIDAHGARIDMLNDTMRDEHNALRNEHTLIIESLGRVAQRVSYIEGHLRIGAATDPEPAGPP